MPTHAPMADTTAPASSGEDAHALEQWQLLTLTCNIVPDVAALAYTFLGAVGDCAVVKQPPGNMQSLLRHAIWIKCFTCWL